MRLIFGDRTKHVVQFSGGAGSAVAAKLVIDEFGPDDVVLLFHDTLAEHPDATRFRADLSAYLGVPITERSCGKSLWEVIDAHNALPSSFMGFCTQELKQQPGERYVQDLEMMGEPLVLYNGMGPDEPNRVRRAKMEAGKRGRKLRCPLDEHDIDDPKSVVQSWGIELPACYSYFKHNNCIPCFKATGFDYWRAVYTHHRPEYERAAELEERFGYTVRRSESLRRLAERFECGEVVREGEERARCAACLD